MTDLPFPTKHRLSLADAIAAGQVKHYHWVNGWSCDTVRDANVTARVDELVRARLAEIPARGDLPESIVRLTPEGMAWVTRARTAGSGSTSPEPGPRVELNGVDITPYVMPGELNPAVACHCNPELFGGKHRWSCPAMADGYLAESTKDGTDER